MFYQELTLLPDAATNINHLWSKVFKQVHLALASQMPEGKKGRIGVSFPQYKDVFDTGLGCKLRLFAEDIEDLEKLEIKSWLRAFSEYVHITDIQPVPVEIEGYAVYRRVHQEPNGSAKARRYAKRHNIAYEEALKLFPTAEPLNDLPFIRLDSESNKNKYCITIKWIPQDGKIVEGFGSYGLDNHSTVPEF